MKPAPTSTPLGRRQALAAAATWGLAGLVPLNRNAWASPAPEPSTQAAEAVAPMWPTHWALEYEVGVRFSGLPFRVSSHLNWQLHGARYEAELRMRLPLVGSRVQRSQGRVLAEGLQPQAFSDQSRRLRRFDFDWSAQRFNYQRENEPARSGSLRAGTQDQLSLFFQLAWWAQRAAPKPGHSWKLPVLDARGVETWDLRVQAQESLTTPAGNLSTWRVERLSDTPGESRLSLWLAERLQFLPARILLQENDGDVADQRLLRLPGA